MKAWNPSLNFFLLGKYFPTVFIWVPSQFGFIPSFCTVELHFMILLGLNDKFSQNSKKKNPKSAKSKYSQATPLDLHFFLNGPDKLSGQAETSMTVNYNLTS